MASITVEEIHHSWRSKETNTATVAVVYDERCVRITVPIKAEATSQVAILAEVESAIKRLASVLSENPTKYPF